MIGRKLETQPELALECTASDLGQYVTKGIVCTKRQTRIGDRNLPQAGSIGGVTVGRRRVIEYVLGVDANFEPLAFHKLNRF